MILILIFSTLIIFSVFLVFAYSSPVSAYNYYYPTGDHTIRMVIKFDSDCWNEIYARATPKNNNHQLLNYVYVYNNDKPDPGPSETIYLYLPFKDVKMQQTKATNEGRIRAYVEIELVDESTGQTVTKYLAYQKDQRIQDFGTYLMKTNPELCR